MNSHWGSSDPKMVSQQASSRFLKTTSEGELMTKGGTCSMARRFAQKEQLFNGENKKNDDETSGGDHEGKDRTVNWRIYPAEGHICRGKFRRREVDQPTAFVFQGNVRYDNAGVECKGGGEVRLPFALLAFGTFKFVGYLSLNRLRMPVWRILSEDKQVCSRAGGALLVLS